MSSKVTGRGELPGGALDRRHDLRHAVTGPPRSATSAPSWLARLAATRTAGGVVGEMQLAAAAVGDPKPRPAAACEHGHGGGRREPLVAPQPVHHVRPQADRGDPVVAPEDAARCPRSRACRRRRWVSGRPVTRPAALSAGRRATEEAYTSGCSAAGVPLDRLEEVHRPHDVDRLRRAAGRRARKGTCRAARWMTRFDLALADLASRSPSRSRMSATTRSEGARRRAARGGSCAAGGRRSPASRATTSSPSPRSSADDPGADAAVGAGDEYASAHRPQTSGPEPSTRSEPLRPSARRRSRPPVPVLG